MLASKTKRQIIIFEDQKNTGEVEYIRLDFFYIILCISTFYFCELLSFYCDSNLRTNLPMAIIINFLHFSITKFVIPGNDICLRLKLLRYS